MMIVTLLAIMLLKDPTSFTILQMPQISAMQDTASDAYSMPFAINAAFYSPLTAYIQKIAGTTTLNRHTRVFTVLRPQLWVSAGRFFAVSSIRNDRVR